MFKQVHKQTQINHLFYTHREVRLFANFSSWQQLFHPTFLTRTMRLAPCTIRVLTSHSHPLPFGRGALVAFVTHFQVHTSAAIHMREQMQFAPSRQNWIGNRGLVFDCSEQNKTKGLITYVLIHIIFISTIADLTIKHDNMQFVEQGINWYKFASEA